MRINLASIIRRDMPARAALQRRLQQATLAAWAAEARATLGRSGKTTAAYVRSLQPDGDTGVALVGTFANMFEQGLGPGGVGTEGPFDLRTTLLRPTTRSIRFGKRGMYLNVPFDMSAAAIKAVGGQSALNAARALPPRQGLPAGLVPKAKPHHATDPLAGLRRQEASYSRGAAPGTQNTYRKWRRISEAGKPWIHPGIVAAHVAKRVVGKMGRIVALAFGWSP